MDDAISFLFYMTILSIFMLVYFLPSIVALLRQHHNWPAIMVCNFLFGWTLLGWGVTLVWSLTAVSRASA